MAADIEVRAYESGDERALVSLFERCFGYRITPEHWLWKLKSQASDYENVWVATHGGRLVGQYVGVPYSARIDGAEQPVIDILDTMVDPEMRRRGVLTTMGEAAHRHWRDAGVFFGYGLPNEQWGTRAAALGWIPLFPLRWLVRVLRPESILARRLHIPAIRRLAPIGAIGRRVTGRAQVDPAISLQVVDDVSGELDEIARAAVTGRVSLVRGSGFVANRYLRCPGARYEVILARRGMDPVGYAVYRLRGDSPQRAVVAEIVTVPGQAGAFGTLVAEIEQRCLRSNVETVLALAVPGSEDDLAFRRCGFMPRRAAFSMQYVPLQEAANAIRHRDDWRLHGGDFDVV